MKRIPIILIVICLALALCPFRAAVAGEKETAKVEEALNVWTQIEGIPEESIPDWMLKNAYAVAVIPHVIKAGFVVGGRYGWGVLSVRSSKGGTWSPPIFVSLTGGSFGWQIGVEAVDVILVFKSSKSIDKITEGRFTLGVDANVSAGPVGRSASAGTEAELRSEVYSYSRSRGLFAGATIEGALLKVDDDANRAFYGAAGEKAGNVFKGDVKIPEPAEAFVSALNKTQ